MSRKVKASRVAVSAAMGSLNGSPNKNEVECSSGVVFRIQPVALGLLQDIQKYYNERIPKPPVVFLEHKGRAEENIDDPDYQEEKQRNAQELLFAQMDALLLKGTTPTQIPDGMPTYKDDSWVDEHEVIAGITIDKRDRGRYLAWVKYVAAPLPTDVQRITEAVAAATGVSEQEVSEAMARFRGEEIS